MGVDTGVTGGTSQVLVFTVRDMEMSLGVAIFLRQTEIDNVDLVPSLANAHEEVVGLDIAMDEVTRVDVLDSGDLEEELVHEYKAHSEQLMKTHKLVGKKENGLETELSVAEVEEVLKRWTQQIENHCVVIAFGAEPSHKGDTHTTSEGLVDL